MDVFDQGTQGMGHVSAVGESFLVIARDDLPNEMVKLLQELHGRGNVGEGLGNRSRKLPPPEEHR
jgi:hypothetical protein